jgi:asparagine synthase (glutamine-hydrolysing)
VTVIFMCGIAGMVSQKPLQEDDQERLHCLSTLLRHRGPDGSGECAHEHALLTVRRLSIIDRQGGGQPLFNKDRSLVLVANAEIYNHIELRAGLVNRGHRFATGSDCEVILHLYEEHGPECLHHLRGMFAFALWDAARQRLFLARDRMGEKPLYLHEAAGKLSFASELKALLEAGCVPFELDAEAVNLFFHYNYVPEPWTPVKGVRKLAAGHYLLVDVPAWQITEKCYWRMEEAPPLEGNPADLIRAELDRIGKLVAQSEVPMGVALSGGLDSSLVALLVAKNRPEKLHAFTVGYEGTPNTDERADARALAEHGQLPWTSVELRTEDVVEQFSDLVYWRDDPIADYASSGYFAVMKLAREHGVSVMLQGHGGDELFWGYPWVRQAVTVNQEKEAYLRSRTRSHQWLRKAWRFFRPRTDASLFAQMQSTPPEQLIYQELSPDFARARATLPGIYAPDFQERLKSTIRVESLYSQEQPWPRIDVWLTRLICQTYLLENGIAQGDRLSMASGVELRLPLVDYRLVETVIGLRKSYPDHQLPPKAWLREAVSDLVPSWVMQRPKRGFQPPIEQWHRGLFQKYGELLQDGYLVQEGILKPGAAREFSQGTFPAGSVAPLCFKALVLEMWCRQFGTRSVQGSVPTRSVGTRVRG